MRDGEKEKVSRLRENSVGFAPTLPDDPRFSALRSLGWNIESLSGAPKDLPKIIFVDMRHSEPPGLAEMSKELEAGRGAMIALIRKEFVRCVGRSVWM